MKKLTYLTWQVILVFSTLVVLIVSYYLQYVKGLQPCSLCIMQRFSVFMLLIISCISLCKFSPSLAKILAVGQVLFSLGGLYFASRQLWLQSLASEQNVCMPGLEVLWHYFPWGDVLRALFLGVSDCGEVVWTGLGLSLAAWTGLYFIFMMLTGVFIRYNLSHNRFFLTQDKRF